MLSGGVNLLARAEYPATLGVDLAVMIELDQDDLINDRDIEVGVRIVGPTGFDPVEFGGHLGWQASDSWPQCVPAPVPLRELEIPSPGTYQFHLKVAELDEIVIFANATLLDTRPR